MLVVIALLAVLASLLLPSLQEALETAREVMCRNNVHRLMTGFLVFSEDHGEQLPGNYFRIIEDPGYSAEEEYKYDWLFGPARAFAAAPQGGTIFPYVDNSAQVFRCASLDVEPAGSGKGSNGRYDYATSSALCGAKIARIQVTARLLIGAAEVSGLPIPIITEEDSANWLNTSLEGSHGGLDQMGRQHRGAGVYAAIDASVHGSAEPPGCSSWNWQAQAPSGAWVTLGTWFVKPAYVPWGWWNQQ